MQHERDAHERDAVRAAVHCNDVEVRLTTLCEQLKRTCGVPRSKEDLSKCRTLVQETIDANTLLADALRRSRSHADAIVYDRRANDLKILCQNQLWLCAAK
jgi:hypothetical protein